MADTIDIRITSSWQNRGVQSALKDIQRLASAQQQAGRSGAQVASPQAIRGVQTLGTAANRTEKSMLSLAQAEARLDVQQGNLTRGAQRLESALNVQSQRTVQVVNAQRQLISINQRAAGQTQSLVTQVGTLTSSLGALGAAFTGLQVVQFTANQVNAANQLERTESVIQNLAQSQEAYSEVLQLAEDRQSRFGGTLQQNLAPLRQAVITSNQTSAELQGLVTVSEQLSVINPFEGMEGGIFAVSEFLSGDVTSLAERFNLSRAALNELKNENVDATTKVQMLSDMLAEQGVTLDVVQSQTELTATTYDRLFGALGDLATGFGGLVAEGLEPTAAATTDVIARSSTLEERWAGLIKMSADLTGMQMTNEQALQRTSQAFAILGISTDTTTAATMSNTTATAEQSAVTQIAANANAFFQSQMELVSLATGRNTQSLTENLTQRIQNEAATLRLNQAQARLAQLADQVAAGLITDANAARILAGEYNFAANEAAFLIQQQLALAKAQAAATAQADAQSAFFADKFAGQQEQFKRNRALAAQAEAQAQLAEQAARASRGGGGRSGGGGGARSTAVSNAQKTNDALLKAATDYQQNREESEREHQQKLLDIQAEFERKSLEQQRENEIGKRESRADFYDELTQSTADIGEDLAGELAGAYEEAYAEAQREAQSGNQQLANDLLELKQEQLFTELDYQQDRARAQEEGDKAEVQRLDAIMDLRRDAMREELKQLEDGGDALVQERDAALAEEQARFAEQQDQLQQKLFETTAGVQEATAEQRAAVIGSLSAQQSKFNEWANSVEAASARARAAINSVPSTPSGGGSGSASAPNAAAGGGNFMTTGPTTLKVGDNPGGQELVTVTPLSGKGTTRVSHNMIALAGGGSVVSGDLSDASNTLRIAINEAEAFGDVPESLERYADAVSDTLAILNAVTDMRTLSGNQIATPIDEAYMRALADEGRAVYTLISGTVVPIEEEIAEHASRYADAVGDAVSVLTDMQSLRADLAMPRPVLDEAYMQALADETRAVGRIVGGVLLPITESDSQMASAYADAVSDSVSILTDMSALRAELGAPQPPISLEYIQQLADETREIGRIVGGVLLPITEQDSEMASRYATAVGDAVSILNSVVDLSRNLEEPVPWISIRQVQKLAERAQYVSAVFQPRVLKVTEQQADDASRYADMVSSAVSTLSSVIQLSRDMEEPIPWISIRNVETLAKRAQYVTAVFRGKVLTTTEEQVEEASRYADLAGSAVSVISGVAQLSRDLGEPTPPISAQQVTKLADDAQRVTEIVRDRLLPTTEEQAEAANQYDQAANASVGALNSVLGLSSDLFADYRSPSDAQLDQLVTDANRIVQRVEAAASTYDTEGLEAAQQFADGVGSMFNAFRDGLRFMDELRFTDASIDPAKLALFEASTKQTIDVAARLSKQAATIPAEDMAALERTTAALSAQAEALINLAAVPFADLPAAAQALNQHGSTLLNAPVSGAPVTINIYQQPGQSAQALANEVLRLLNQKTGARR